MERGRDIAITNAFRNKILEYLRYLQFVDCDSRVEIKRVAASSLKSHTLDVFFVLYIFREKQISMICER